MAFGVARFADFELDCGRYELRRGDRVLKLEKIPMDLLALLVESNGHLVSRDQIIEKIWGKDVFLDTEHGINTAVRKIRQALGDDPEQPRFVQTVTGKGYRFIAPVAVIGEARRNGDGSRKASLATEPRPEVLPVSSEPSAPTAPTSRDTNPTRPSKALRIASLSTAALVLLAAALVGFNVRGWRDQLIAHPNSQRISALAVLPLENLSGDPTQDYFADGMTDELITMLAKHLPMRVISRTSVMQYKNVHRPLPEIARELGVDGILEGSVVRSGNRVHLAAQLIYAPSDTHVWANSFNRDLSDVGGLQDELAETIAKQVGAKTSGTAKSEGRRINPEAHDAYLLGRYYWYANDTKKSRTYFEKAIELQPDYAVAWAGLSDYYTENTVVGEFPPEAAMPQAEAAAKKALELDDLSAEAHLSMAGIQLFYRWNWAAAERESARAIELNPNLALAHQMRSFTLRPLNRLDEALQEERKAMELDPFSSPDLLGWALLRARQFDAALNEALMRRDVQPTNPDIHYLLSYAYFYKGLEKESEEELERCLQLNGDKDRLAEQVRVYRRGGFRAVLEWEIEVLKRKASKKYVPPTEFAEAYAQLGRKEETIRYLEKSYRERAPQLAFLQSEPAFEFLRSDPRYRDLVSKMGLPPAY